MNVSKRLGRFRLSMSIINLDPKTVMRVLGKMVIVRAETLYAEKCVEYMAMSNLFEVVEEAEQIPMYRLSITATGKVSAEKV
jgi:hypothetical protein